MQIKKSLLFLPMLILATSCQWFDKRVPSKDDLLEKELKAINWDEVDEWPSAKICDTIADEEAKRACFFQFLTDTIHQRLASETLKISYPELDTVEVKVTVMPDSTVHFQSRLSDTAKRTRRSIDSTLLARLDSFPKVIPALKRGLPVKTQFVLPLVLDVQKEKKKRR